jgi:hypothetical protein
MRYLVALAIGGVLAATLCLIPWMVATYLQIALGVGREQLTDSAIQLPRRTFLVISILEFVYHLRWLLIPLVFIACFAIAKITKKPPASAGG